MFRRNRAVDGKRRELEFRCVTNNTSLFSMTGTATTAASDTRVSKELVTPEPVVVGAGDHDIVY